MARALRLETGISYAMRADHGPACLVRHARAVPGIVVSSPAFGYEQLLLAKSSTTDGPRRRRLRKSDARRRAMVPVHGRQECDRLPTCAGRRIARTRAPELPISTHRQVLVTIREGGLRLEHRCRLGHARHAAHPCSAPLQLRFGCANPSSSSRALITRSTPRPDAVAHLTWIAVVWGRGNRRAARAIARSAPSCSRAASPAPDAPGRSSPDPRNATLSPCAAVVTAALQRYESAILSMRESSPASSSRPG